jgi:hypothetical protein
VTDDLLLWQRIVNAERDEGKARWAAVLSIAAIIMLLITSFTLAHRGTINAAPQAVSTSLLPLELTEAAPSTHYCTSLRNGQWLQAVSIQRDRHGFEWHECYYGRVQIRAGDANL